MGFLRQRLAGLFVGTDSWEQKKTLYLVLSFFLVIGCYTLIREVRDTIFLNTVGREYAPWARIYGMVALVPAILIYSRLVDVLRRHALLYVYCLVYGIGLCAIAYFVGHPTIGLLNNNLSCYRWFGWITYFFIEGFVPFVVSLFWAFSNSINDPETAKNSYAFITAGSKFGGMVAAGTGILILRTVATAQLTDIQAHQILLAIGGGMLLIVPILIYFLMQSVPRTHLHGYEAAYELERDRAREQRKKRSYAAAMQSMMSGLTMLVRSPYVFGIFGLVGIWEVIKAVLSYERLSIGKATTTTLSELSLYLLEQAFFLHMIGIFIALVGVRMVIRILGERWSLLLVPLINVVLIAYYLHSHSARAVAVAYVLMSSLNYAFASPLREILYIPTTKDMKFKAKSWIDAFGAKVAKSCGSYFNVLTSTLAPDMLGSVQMVFFTCIFISWGVISYFMGKRYDEAIAKGEVIGSEELS
jgi:AAA family ATP:ADP antiporter